MIALSIINDELFIETENQILHTKIVNTNWDKIKIAVLLEFLQEAYKDGDLCESCSNSLDLRLKDKELEG